MNGEPMEDITVNEQPVEAATAENQAPATSTRLLWRIGLAVVAVAVVVVLVYPFLQQRLAAPAESEPALAGQEAGPAEEAAVEANSAQAQFRSGNSHAQAGRWDQARAAYQKAIELDPNFQAAYANLGVVYYQLEQLDLAASQYQKALELDPDDGDVAYNLGALYLQQALIGGEQPDQALLERAVTQLKQAAELSPGLAEPYFSLGVAYQVSGQTEQAIEAFETFLARDSVQDPRASQEAQRYLELLRSQ
jgi:tetratricopeptide (TPR) repeat protein